MLKKQKERNKRNKIKKQNQQFERLYPKFSFYKEEAVEPELVKLVKDAVNFLFNSEVVPTITKKSIDLNVLYKFMKIMTKSGVKEASDYLTNLKMENISKPIAFICCSFADLIISVSDKIKTYLPHSGFIIGVKRGIRDTFFIKFKKIRKYINQYGSRYKSNDAQKHTINNKSYDIVFSTHCINRFQDRFIMGKIAMYAQLQFFYYLIEKSKFKLIYNEFNEPMLEMYCPILNEFNSIAEKFEKSKSDLPFLDEDEKRKNHCIVYMKYFYLPISFEDDQIICLTALLPGFKQTPEYKFRKTAIAKNTIRTFNNRKEEETFRFKYHSTNEFYKNENIQAFDQEYKEILIWFHENGLPQFCHASDGNIVNMYNIGTEKEIEFV